jgi:LysM repeat protein
MGEKMRNSKALFVIALMSGMMAIGCSNNKRIEGTDVPAQPQSNETVAAPIPTPVPNPAKKYIVVTGDTLWGISGSSNGYNDSFQWPLIFKANRDQIKDPDLIYPKQEFSILTDYSDTDVAKAKKDAEDTPKYVPHTKPRETLPVDYF